MYEMFGDCGLRSCLPLQKLMRGRMLQVTTKPPNILYMMLYAVFIILNLDKGNDMKLKISFHLLQLLVFPSSPKLTL